MPDSRIITGGLGTPRVPTLYGRSRFVTGIGEVATLSLQVRHLQWRSRDDRLLPEPWGPGSMSRLMLHECTVADELPNKPLEPTGFAGGSTPGR